VLEKRNRNGEKKKKANISILRIRVCITAGTPERAAAFIRQLHRAAEIMRDIVESM
jgi:hypothetical protein